MVLDDAQVPVLLTEQYLLQSMPPHAAEVVLVCIPIGRRLRKRVPVSPFVAPSPKIASM